MSIPFHTNDLEIDQHQSLDMIKNNKTKSPAGSKTVPSPGRIRALLYQLFPGKYKGLMIPIILQAAYPFYTH